MHRLLIENYIKQSSKQDIKAFALKHNILLKEEDVDILYHYLKNNWQDLLYGNSRSVFEELEEKLGTEKFNVLKNLYDFYFEQYHDFL